MALGDRVGFNIGGLTAPETVIQTLPMYTSSYILGTPVLDAANDAAAAAVAAARKRQPTWVMPAALVGGGLLLLYLMKKR